MRAGVPAVRRRPKAGGELRLQAAGIFGRPDEAPCTKLAASVPFNKLKLHHLRKQTLCTTLRTCLAVRSLQLTASSLVFAQMTRQAALPMDAHRSFVGLARVVAVAPVGIAG